MLFTKFMGIHVQDTSERARVRKGKSKSLFINKNEFVTHDLDALFYACS